jgi:hypothetical protein
MRGSKIAQTSGCHFAGQDRSGTVPDMRVILPDIGALAHARVGELRRRVVDRVRTCFLILEVLMSESATVMIPEPMPMFGPVQLAAAGFLARLHHGRP